MRVINHGYHLRSLSMTKAVGSSKKKLSSFSELKSSSLMMKKDVKRYEITSSELKVKLNKIVKDVKQNSLVEITIKDKKNTEDSFAKLVNSLDKNYGYEMKKDQHEEGGKGIHKINLDASPGLYANWSRNALSPVYPHSEDSYDPKGVDVFAVVFLKNNIKLPLQLLPIRDSVDLLLGSHEDRSKQSEFNIELKKEVPLAFSFWTNLSLDEKAGLLTTKKFLNKSGANIDNLQEAACSFLFHGNDMQLCANWNCNEDRLALLDNSFESKCLYEVIQRAILFTFKHNTIDLIESDKIVIFPNYYYFHGRLALNDTHLKELNGADLERTLVRSKLKIKNPTHSKSI